MNARTNELTTKAKSDLMKNAMQRAACQYITEGSLRDGQRILNAMDSLNGISSDSDESAGRFSLLFDLITNAPVPEATE